MRGYWIHRYDKKRLRIYGQMEERNRTHQMRNIFCINRGMFNILISGAVVPRFVPLWGKLGLGCVDFWLLTCHDESRKWHNGANCDDRPPGNMSDCTPKQTHFGQKLLQVEVHHLKGYLLSLI